jgi:hypothetical protein
MPVERARVERTAFCRHRRLSGRSRAGLRARCVACVAENLGESRFPPGRVGARGNYWPSMYVTQRGVRDDQEIVESARISF